MFKELETVIHCDESEQTPEPTDQPMRSSHRLRPTTISKHEQRSRQRSYRSSQSQNYSKSPYSHSSRPVSPYNCYNGNTSAKRFQNTKQNNDLSCRSYSISDKNSKWQTPLSPENYTKEVQSPQLNIVQEVDQNIIYEQTLECKVHPNLLVHTAILSSQKSTNSFRNTSGMKIQKLLERSMQNSYLYTENHSTDQNLVDSSSKKDNRFENQRFLNRNNMNQVENLEHQLHMSMLLNSDSYPSQLSHLSFNDPKKANQNQAKGISQNNMNIIQNYQNNINYKDLQNYQDCIDSQNMQNQYYEQQQHFQNQLQNPNVQSINSVESSQKKDQFNYSNNNIKKLKSSRQNIIQMQQQLHLKQPVKFTNLKPILNFERNKNSQINNQKVSLNQPKNQYSHNINKENQFNQLHNNQQHRDNLSFQQKMGKRNEKQATSSGQSLRSNISIQVSGKYKDKSQKSKKLMSYGNIKQEGALEKKQKNLMDTIEQVDCLQQQQLNIIKRSNQANIVFDQTSEKQNEAFQSPIISEIQTPNPQQLYYQQEVRNNYTPVYQSNDITKSPSHNTGNLNSQYKDNSISQNPSGAQLISERTQPNSYQMPSPHFPCHNNFYMQQSSKNLLHQQSSQKDYLLDQQMQNVYQDQQYPNSNYFQDQNLEKITNIEKNYKLNNDLNSLMQSSQREVRMGEQNKQNYYNNQQQQRNDSSSLKQNQQQINRKNEQQYCILQNQNNNQINRRTPFEQNRNAVFHDQNYQEALLNGMQHSRIHDVQFFNMNETFSTGQDNQQFSSDKDNFTHYEQISLPIINQTNYNHVNQTQQDNSMYNQNLSFSPEQKYHSELYENYQNEKQYNHNFHENNQNGMQNYQYRQNDTIEQSDSQINEPSQRSDMNMNRDHQTNMLINTHQNFSPQSYQYPQSMNNRDHPQYFHDMKNNHKTMDERMNADRTFDNILSNGMMSQHESMNHTFSQRNSCLKCLKQSHQIPSTLHPSINQAQSSKEAMQLISYHPSQLLSPENQNTHVFETCPCCNARKDVQAHALMNANNQNMQGFQNFSGYFNNNQNLSNSVSTLQGGGFSSNQLLPLADFNQEFKYPQKKCDIGIQANSFNSLQNEHYFTKRAVKMIESDQEKKALKRRLGRLSSAKSKSQKKQKKSRTCSIKKQGLKYINSNSLVTIRQGKIVQKEKKSLLNNFQNQLTRPLMYKSVRSLSQKRKQSLLSNKTPQFKICQSLKEVFQHLGIQTYLHLLQDRNINSVSQILLLDSEKLKQMLMPANARKLLLSYQKQLIKHLNSQIKFRKQLAKDAMRKYKRNKRSNTVQIRKGKELKFQNEFAQSTLQFINPPMKFHVDQNNRSKSQMLIKHLSKRKLFEDDIKVYSRNQDQLKLARQKINQKNQQQIQIMSNTQSQSSLPVVNVGYKGVSIFQGALNKKWMGTWGDQTLKSKDTKTMNNSLKNLKQSKSPNSMSQKSILKSKSTNKFGISRNSQTSINSKKTKKEKTREQSPIHSIVSSKNNSKYRRNNKNIVQNSVSGQNSIQSSQSKTISINISKNKKNENKQKQKKQKKKKKSEEKENNDNIFNLNKSNKQQKIQALLNELSNLLKEDKRTPMFTPGDSKSNNQLLEEKFKKIRNTSSPSKQIQSPSQYVLSSFKKQTQFQNKSEIVNNQNYNQDIENVILNSTENEQNLTKNRKFNQTAHIVEQLKRQIDALSSNKNTMTEQSETLSKNQIDHNIRQESDYDNIFQRLTLNASQDSKNSKHYLNKLRKLSQQNLKKGNIKSSEMQTQIQSPIQNVDIKNETNEINIADYEQNKNLFNLDANALSFNLLQDVPGFELQDQNLENNEFIQNDEEQNEVSQSYSGYQKQQNRQKQRLINNLPSTQINSIDMENNFRDQQNDLNNIFDYKFTKQKEQRKSMQNMEHEDSSIGSSSAYNQPATRRTNPCQNNQFLNFNNNQFGNNNDESNSKNQFANEQIQSQNSHITSPSYQSVNYFNDLNSNMMSNRIKDSLKTKISSPQQFYQNNRNQSLTVNDMTLGAQQRGANDYHKHDVQVDEDAQNDMEQEYFTQCIVGGEVVFKNNQFNMKTSPDFKDIVLNTGSSQENLHVNQYYINQQINADYQNNEDFMNKSLKTQLKQIYQPKTPFTSTYNTRGLPIPVYNTFNKGQDLVLPYSTLNSQPEFNGKQIISQFERNKYLFEKAQLEIKQFHQNVESVQNRLQKINHRVK